MLGRKNYTKEEIAQGRAAMDQQVAAYKKLVKAGGADPEVKSALEAFGEPFFNNMILVLDRHYVHRLPGADYEGKDGNPLNEVRIVCDSLMNNKGLMRGDKQIKLALEKSVLKLKIGDPIKLSESDFGRLSTAFFAELQRRFG
jgi:hypothetical protein